MGFDANNDDRIIVCAYAYTGDVPKFLGTWSIDVYGENSKLEALDGSAIPVAVVGYRLEEDSEVIHSSETEFDVKREKDLNKQKEKDAKKVENFEKKVRKLEYKRKLEQMDMQTLIKIKERQKYIKDTYKKSEDGLTGS